MFCGPCGLIQRDSGNHSGWRFLNGLQLNALSLSPEVEMFYLFGCAGETTLIKLVDRSGVQTARVRKGDTEQINYHLVQVYSKCIIIFSPVCERT